MSPRVKPVLRGRRWKKGDIQGITPEELQHMIKVAKNDRYAKRNEVMLLVGFSFGLRVNELLTLKIQDIDLDNNQIHIERAKNGKTRANGRDLMLPNGKRLFLGSSGTGAPYENELKGEEKK